MSVQSDRTATMVGRDMKTYNLENSKKKKRKEAESKLIFSEKERRNENAVAVLGR